MKLIRQGDVMLRRVSQLPRGATKRDENQLRIPGEDGHHHDLKGAALYEHNGQPVAVVPNGDTAVLDHDEHDRAEIPSGVWVVSTAQAHDWPSTTELQAERDPPQPTQEQRPAQPSQPQPSRPRTRPHRD